VTRSARGIAASAARGFCDQSHLIAEFRELAGTTPDAFHFSNR
jgi:AraC-like DNA-binding protein